jgi:diadenosine tetraphosphate (Ap4A) HIT family hydrolase
MPENQSVYLTNPDVKARQVAENETAWAFLTNIPITPGHTLVAPKRVVATIDELTQLELLDIFALASQVRQGLKSLYGAEGFNSAWNEGEKYGQSIPHFHLHIVPRTLGDEGITKYEPRTFLYRPGSREATPEAELKVVAHDLSQSINSL